MFADLGNLRWYWIFRSGIRPPRNVLVSALLIVLTFALAACGGSSTGPAQASPGAARPTNGNDPATRAPASNGQASQIGAEVLDYYFPATPKQYEAGSLYQAQVSIIQNQLTAKCMASYGFKLQVETSVSNVASGLYDLSQFPDLAQMKQTGLMLPLTAAANNQEVVAPQVPSSQQAAYQADMTRCTTKGTKPFAGTNAIVQPLYTAWIGNLNKIQASSQVQGDLSHFSSCVQQAGAPADYSQNFNRFTAWAGAEVTNNNMGPVEAAPDRRWGHVFVQCGWGLESLYERLQTTARSQFFQSNYQAIQQLQSQVTKIVLDAQKQVGA
jgi:hypothetical protein